MGQLREREREREREWVWVWVMAGRTLCAEAMRRVKLRTLLITRTLGAGRLSCLQIKLPAQLPADSAACRFSARGFGFLQI